MTKFRNKYRIESSRLRNWDYSSDGAYFITICTKDREHFFGEIVDGKMQFSENGKMAGEFWEGIETKHDFVILDEWVVMPNHIHGIIFIQKNMDMLIAQTTTINTRRDTPLACLYDNVDNMAHPYLLTRQRKFGQLPKKSIASMINHFKGAIKKWANANGWRDFCWQKNYHDHIIRNEKELNRIREYIFNNPLNWELDYNNQKMSARPDLTNPSQLNKIKRHYFENQALAQSNFETTISADLKARVAGKF